MVVTHPKKMNVPSLDALMKGDVAVATAKLFNYSDQRHLTSRVEQKHMHTRMQVHRWKCRHTQLLLPPILTPLARILNGKTSDVTIQATGPKPVRIKPIASSRVTQ